MSARHLAAAFAAACVASPAWAEVSDKIATPTGLWGWAAGFAFAALLLSLWRPALGLAVIPLAAFYAWAGHEMVSDAHIGPAILREQGEGYVQTVYLSGAAGVIAPLVVVAILAAIRAHRAGRQLA
jgi:hypothetical protein